MENNEIFIVDDNFLFKSIKLVDERGAFYPSISVNDAKLKSERSNLNLVCFSLPQEDSKELPLCKIIDYYKWKYNNDKFKKQQLKMSKQETKEIRFSSNITINDIKHKVKQLKNTTDHGGIGIVAMEVNLKSDKQKTLAYNKLDEILSYCNEFSKISTRKENDGKITVSIVKK